MKDIVVVKTGGKAASDMAAMEALFREMQKLSSQYAFILVHGGGAELSRISKVFNLEPVFKDGVRLTTPPEMEIADMVLGGKMNKELVEPRFGIREVRCPHCGRIVKNIAFTDLDQMLFFHTTVSALLNSKQQPKSSATVETDDGRVAEPDAGSGEGVQ